MDRSMFDARLEVETTRADEEFSAAIQRLPEHLRPAMAEYCRQEVDRTNRSLATSRRAALGEW